LTTLAQVIQRGVFASLPAAGSPGRLYFASDTGNIYRDNGTTWDETLTTGIVNPMTVEGDLIVGGTSGAPTRLAAGADADVLTLVSGSPAWAAPSGGGGGSFTVDGASISGTPDINGTTPAAPLTHTVDYATNIKWQVSGSSVSAYVPFLYNDGATTVSYNPSGYVDPNSTNNVAIGWHSMDTSSPGTAGNLNACVGYNTMVNPSNPSHRNVAVGAFALQGPYLATDTVAIGYSAANQNREHIECVFIGSSTGNNSADATNAIAIGYNIDNSTNNSVILGNSSVVQTTLQGVIIPGTIYSASGTPLPSASSALKGSHAVVSDATTPTYMGAYVSGGNITAAVICSFDGTTYAWLTH
jgi:hypothetical protein